MKKLHYSSRILFASLLGLGTSVSALAEIVEYKTPDKIVYQIDTSTGEACAAKLISAAADNPNLVIADAVDYEGKSYKVTSIGKQACINNALLETIKFGQNVTMVDSAAFDGSSKLKQVMMNPGVRVLKDAAFANCTALETIENLDKTTQWGNYLFQGAKGIKEFSIPASVEKIGLNPFRSCSALTNIIVAEGNKNYMAKDGVLFSKDMSTLIGYPIGNGKSSYIVPEGVTKLGTASMRNNTKLTQVIFPSTLEEIGEMALAVCNLQSITISEGIKTIGGGAFFMNNSLVSIEVDPLNPYYKVENGVLTTKDGKTLVNTVALNGAFAIPDGVENIGNYAFYGQSGLTKVSFPASMRAVGTHAFYNCKGLTTVEFNEGLVSIGYMAFQNSSALDGVKFPTTLKSLDSQAFCYCTGMTTIEFNDNLESIGGLAFYGCSKLKSVKLGGNLKNLGHSIFYGCSALETAEIADGPETLAGSMFAYCGALKTLNLPSTLKVLNDYIAVYTSVENADLYEGLIEVEEAAYEVAGLKGDIKLPNSVKKIGPYSFAWNPAMTSFTTGTELEEIEDHGLHKCETLEKVTLNEGLKKIGYMTFASDVKLKELTIPSTVVSIDSMALNNTTELLNLYLLPIVPPATNGILYYVPHWDGYSFTTLHVPAGSVEAYKTHPEWGKFTKIVGDAYDSVENLDAEEVKIKEIYTLDGVLLKELMPGINICKMSDGSVRKVMKK